MTQLRRFSILLGAAFVATVAFVPAALAQAPADGNGNKTIIPLMATVTGLDLCGTGDLLDVEFDGYLSVKESRGNRHVYHLVAHLIVTFTNSDGDTYVWQDVGGEFLSIDKDGNFVLAKTGRIPNALDVPVGDLSVIGRSVVINFDNETLTTSGQVGPDLPTLACAALT